MHSYVIIGGGLAAARAAKGIRSVDPDGPITIITDEQHWPYQRPALSKGYLQGKTLASKLTALAPNYAREHNIDVRRGIVATAIDRQAHLVSLSDGNQVGYTRLLLATGGRAIRLPIPGADLPNVFALRTVEDSNAIRAAARPGQRALVIGGSFIGSEVAASLSQLGVKVTMAFLEPRLLARIAPAPFADYLAERFAQGNITLAPEVSVERLDGAAHVESAVLSNGQTIAVDFVVMGVGIRLNTTLAREAELELTERGAVVVDPFLRTSDPAVFAAGDIAAWPDPNYGRQLRVEHWDVAYQQGYAAGRNMAGAAERYATIPYFFSDLFELSFEVWGNLDAWDRTALRGTPKSGACAVYYFDQGKLVGVLAMGRPDDERDPMQALIARQPAYDDVATLVADESVALSDLVP
jgi:3-phenylpropionate/trans-cinnamate dioxygenase ferredoxin reductase subunit